MYEPIQQLECTMQRKNTNRTKELAFRELFLSQPKQSTNQSAALVYILTQSANQSERCICLQLYIDAISKITAFYSCWLLYNANYLRVSGP